MLYVNLNKIKVYILIRFYDKNHYLLYYLFITLFIILFIYYSFYYKFIYCNKIKYC